MKKSEYMTVVNEWRKEEMEQIREIAGKLIRSSERGHRTGYPLSVLLTIMKQFTKLYQIYLECEEG